MADPITFRLKMWDPNTGKDKGWLGVSDGNNVQLFSVASEKSRAAICQWVDAGGGLFYLQVNNASVYRWLGVGTSGAATWGLTTSGGWHNKIRKDNNVIALDEGNRRGLVDNHDMVDWAESNILHYTEVFVPKSPFFMKLRIDPGATFSIKLTQDDPGKNNIYSVHPTNDIRTLERIRFDKVRFEIYRYQSNPGEKITAGQIEMVSNGTDTYPLDTGGLLKFDYNQDKSEYPDKDPNKQTNFYDVYLSPPPIILNTKWHSGMNDGGKTWVQDYGVDEPGRWSPDPGPNPDGFIYQSTAAIGSNFGSRAYPIDIPPSEGSPYFLTMREGPGVAHEGLWQICMKIGSNGAQDNPFTESFYIAERADIFPGPARYTDGGSTDISTREIDIFETKWSSYRDGNNKIVARPHINLPNGGNTGWNPDAGQGDKDKKQYGMTNRVNPGWWPKFEEVGGAPTKDYYIVVGCLIRGDNLWIYAYHDNGKKQWYCTRNIPKVSQYDQKNPFVPYIGTWCGRGNKTAGGFKTGFGGFVYLAPDDKLIKDKNPYDHPDAFGIGLVPKVQGPRAS